MGLLEGMRVVRSGDPEMRAQAIDIDDFFVDVEYEGELVRARRWETVLRLHKGGNAYIDLPLPEHDKRQISPTRDTRLRWMQSIVHCTHYVAGAGEIKYLNTDDAPEVEFVTRDAIAGVGSGLPRVSRALPRDFGRQQPDQDARSPLHPQDRRARARLSPASRRRR